MTTIGVLADEALGELYGHSQTVDSTTYLSSAMDTDDLTVVVASAGAFSRGLVQVGNELLIVDSVDRGTNTLSLGTIAGRGVRGTTVSAHAVGELVTMAPTIPRSSAIRAIGEIIRSASGLFAVGSLEITFVDPATYGYTVPSDVVTVLDVSWMPPMGNAWLPVRKWEHDRYANLVVLGGSILPGATVRVHYTKAPTVPAEGAEFTTSGLPQACEDVVRLGAAWKLSSFLEPQSLMAQGAEADRMGRASYPATRIRVSQYFYQVYQSRLAEERQALAVRYPTTAHYGA